MNEELARDGEPHDSLAEVLTEYLLAAEVGQEPPRQVFLARYPDLAQDLEAFFLDGDGFKRLAAPLRFLGVGPNSDSSVCWSEKSLALPCSFGDYDLLEEIARGGMGVVYRARQKSVNRLVAVKRIRAGTLASAEEVQRFRNEAAAVAHMDHPHIVPLYEVGAHDGQPYFSMKLIEGRSLAEQLDRYKADFKAAARLLARIARAVHYAHQRGVLHRDLKPSNVLLDANDLPYVTDFGLAKRVEANSDLTQSGMLVGTPSYMAPEQANGQRQGLTTAADVYGLGAVLYALICGRPPFLGETVLETLEQVKGQEPVRPSARNPRVDRELDAVCLKCLEKDANRRYASAEALAEDLDRWLRGEAIAARPAGAAKLLWRWGRRHRIAIGVAVCLMLTLTALAGSAGWVLRDRAVRGWETEQAANAALEEADTWQQARRLPEALAAARRAAWLIDSGVASETVAERVHARRDDLELVEKLENVRLEMTAVDEGHFDYARSNRLYGEAFRGAGLDVEALPPDQVGESIRKTTVAVELAAALDHWAFTHGPDNPKAASWKHLLRVARAADPDPDRSRLRDALMQADKKTLMDLATADTALRFLPSTLCMLTTALRQAGADQNAVTLLREAQRRHPDDFWINTDLAMAFLPSQPHHLEESLRFFTVALALRPQSPGAHYNVGFALGVRGDLDEAIAQFQEAIRLKDDYAQAHYNLGSTQAKKGQLDAAIAEFREAIRFKKDLASAHQNLGFALAKKGKLDEAIFEYREAIRLKTDNALAHNNLGNALNDKGLLVDAIAEYREAVRLKKDYPEAHGNLGSALIRNGHQDEGIAEYREAVRLKPELAGTHNNLGAALRDNGQHSEAIAEFREAIGLNKDFVEAHFNLANALREKGLLAAAMAEYLEAIRLKEDFPEAHSNLGAALAATGRFEQAIAEFRAAIRLKKDYPEAHCNLGSALAAKGQPDEAIAEFREAMRLKEGYADAHCGLGNALMAKGQVDKGIIEYRGAIELKKEYAEAHNNLGSALLVKGQMEEALAEFREAIRFKKDYAVAHYNLGLALQRKGQLDQAIAEYREVLRLKKDYANAHYNLGNALRLKGRLDEAIGMYREAILLKKDHAEAHNNLGLTLHQQGELDGAIAEFREAIRLKPDLVQGHVGLGTVFQAQGLFAEALAEMKLGHEFASRKPGQPQPTAELVRNAERLVELDAHLPQLLNGEAQPADAAERVALAAFCQRYKKLFSVSARWYAEAFSARPALADNLTSGNRYNAAGAAALAGCGQGQDAGNLDDKERARLRLQALDWLRADLEAWREVLAKEHENANPVVVQRMQHWLTDPDFAGVRGENSVAKLPEGERRLWLSLWLEVEALRQRAVNSPSP
jgi:tetratricopeptide (TPR) repeat protein/tRNA A-37 threonylcarbamoyl transferase component Bud32